MRKQSGESREVVGGMIVFGIDETNKGVEADEVNVRGRGRVFAGLNEQWQELCHESVVSLSRPHQQWSLSLAPISSSSRVSA